MDILPADLHLLAHTARMLHVLSERADHPRATEYAMQIGAYKARWSQLDGEQRDAVSAASVDEVHDMTDETVAAARAALEG